MAGTYTDIVEIIAPSEAAAGETVSVEVRVKNLHTAGIYITVTGLVDGVELLFGSVSPVVGSGDIHSYYDSFVMPSNSVTLWAWSWYWGTDGEWHQDDEASRAVALAEEYIGTISKMELEYNESRADIPASGIPQNQRGLVHIWGRNDTDETQRMGIYWIVRGPPGYPDGPILEEYFAWEAWPYTGSGKEHEFIGGRFNLDEAGLYDIRCGLLMNPDNPIYVDIYYGDLCTVIAELVPTFSNFGIKSYSSA